MQQLSSRRRREGLRLAFSLALATVAGLGATMSFVSPTAATPLVPDGGITGDSGGVVDGLTGGEIVTLDFNDHPLYPISASFQLDGEVVNIDLVEKSVRAEGYQVLKQVATGELVPVEPGPVNTFRGQVRENPDSRVIAGMSEDGLFAKIVIPGRDVLWMEPRVQFEDGADASEYVLYTAADVIPGEGVCGLEGPIAEMMRSPTTNGVAGTDEIECAQLACDADNEYFDDYNTVEAVENRINLVIGIVNDQYESEVGITHIISAIIVRTSEPDPYTSTNAGVLLDQFRNEWIFNQTGIARDVSQLFTGKSLQGSTIGLAWSIGQICTTGAYCLVESDFSSFLICVTDLSAHELGHLWNGFHCTCPSHTMNPSITCANTFNATFTIPDIIAHRNSRTCLTCPILGPPNDNCGSATPVPEGSTPYTTVAATTDGPSEPGCASSQNQTDSDVWFNFFATCDGQLSVGTCNATFNTKLIIYEFDPVCPTNSGTFIACNDNGCSIQSVVTFPCNADTIYRIRVGGIGGQQGTGDLTIILDCDPPPPSCPCDFNESGAVTVDDLLALLAAWGTPGADCTEDGSTTVDDLLALLATWGPCE